MVLQLHHKYRVKRVLGYKYGFQGLDASQGIPPDSPLVEQCRSYRLNCLTPPGTGLNNEIIIGIPGAQSRAIPNFVFDYGVPVITDVTELSNAAVSYIARGPGGTGGRRQLQAGLLNGVPTVGTLVAITGRNFGDAALEDSSGRIG